MAQSQAMAEHIQKIHRAKQRFEIDGGKTIDPARVQEWALLEIAEMLRAIHIQMVQSHFETRG
jgi:hypothetical protein